MHTILQTPTPDKKNSLDFYDKLGFQTLFDNGEAIVTDGKVFIMIDPDRFARTGVRIYKTSWKEEVKEVEKLTRVHQVDNDYLLSDLSNVRITLVEGEPPVPLDPRDESFALPGNFHGVSIEATDMERTLDIWKTLGFEEEAGDIGQGFLSLRNENGFNVNLMGVLTCPHVFPNPALNYFNGKENPAIIERIRNAKVPILEGITYFSPTGEVDNISLQDPGGLGFFIFND